MMRSRIPSVFVVCALSILVAAPGGLPAGATRTLVVCSPGSPGNTEQAQPTMDAFAHDAATAAGWSPAGLGAIYFETAQAGLARLEQDDAALAMVPLPFFVKYGAGLKLDPILTVAPETAGGDPPGGEVWALVAKKGAVRDPGSLAGWEITGTPGYAESFVRRVILSDFGPLPADTTVSFTPRVLAALRKAAAGEKVAALLDETQTAALGSLPFGSDLEIVARSRPLPSALMCVVRGRLDAEGASALSGALRAMRDTPEGRKTLASIRVDRFEPVDRRALDTILGQAAAEESAP